MEKRYLGVGLMINNLVSFDLDIYSESAIQQAIADYKEYAEITCSTSKECCICHLTNCKFDLWTTIREFSNYVLMLSVQQRK